jgi:uncharacterized membrane protein YjfL (UPF0719 family)
VYTIVFDFFYIESSEGNVNGSIRGAVRRQLPREHEIQLPGHLPTLKQGNVAVAISYAAMMVSYSILISGAVYQSYELASFAVWLVGGGVLLLLLRELLDRVVVPGVNLDRAMAQDFNWGFAMIIGAMQLSAARILVAILAMDCRPYRYTAGPGVRDVDIQRQGFTDASNLSLIQHLTQYSQTLDIFTWEHLLGVTTSLVIMFLGKFTYQVSDCTASCGEPAYCLRLSLASRHLC